MYRIICDDKKEKTPIMDVRDEELVVIDPEIKEGINKISSFSFDIAMTNPAYENVKKLSTEIIVEDKESEMFRGRCIEDKSDFYNTKSVICEGAMAYLADTKYPPYIHDGSVDKFISDLLDYHNSKVTEKQKIYLGKVTVKDLNDYIRRESEKYDSIYNIIQGKLLDKLGGWIRIRRENEKNYLDYLEEYIDSGQTAKFGGNIVDLTKHAKAESIKTVLIPLGAKDKEGNRIDITSVNKGKNYIKNDTLIEEYGWIEDVVIWDDVTEPSNLLKKAKEYFSECQNMTVSVEINMIEARTLGLEIERITPGMTINVESKPHNINTKFLCTSKTTKILEPSKNTIIIGNKFETLTETIDREQHEASEEIEKVDKELSDEIQKAKDDFKDALENASGLYKTEVKQSDGSTIVYYHDKKNLKDSQIQMVFNTAGFGITADGGDNWYGMQVDGDMIANILSVTGINADWIRTGKIRSKDFSEGVSGTEFNLNTSEITTYQKRNGERLKTTISKDSITFKNLDDPESYARMDIYGMDAWSNATNSGVTIQSDNVSIHTQKDMNRNQEVRISKSGIMMNDKTYITVMDKKGKYRHGASGRAEFSDGSYLEYVNGILVGGKTAEGTTF